MLSPKSITQAKEVVSQLHANNIVRIHTRGALDRIIEQVKFPRTRSRHYQAHASGKRTLYKSQQYDPIRHWLVDNGYLVQTHDGYRYHYTVVKPPVYR